MKLQREIYNAGKSLQIIHIGLCSQWKWPPIVERSWLDTGKLKQSEQRGIKQKLSYIVRKVGFCNAEKILQFRWVSIYYKWKQLNDIRYKTII